MPEKHVSKNFRRLIQAAVLISVVIGTSSCVPLLIGGVVGYVAHSEGIGVVRPIGSGGSQSYDEPAADGNTGGYDTDTYDEPVY